MTEALVPLRSLDVSDVAAPYLEGLLSHGRGLARAISSAIDWEAGRFEVFLPEDVQGPLSERQLRLGGVWGASNRRPRWSSRSAEVSPVARLAELVAANLSDAGSLGLVENSLDAQTDRETIAGSDASYYVLPQRASTVVVRHVLEEADNAWLMLGFVAKPGGSSALSSEMPDFASFESSVKLVFSTAMDGESYLIWQRGAPGLGSSV